MNLSNGLDDNFQNGVDNPSYLLTQIDSSKYNLKDAVKLPIGENPKEWIANNIIDFHKQIRMLYGTISEYCNANTCPKMTAGKKFEFLWSVGREPVGLCASQYICHLLNWVQEQLDNEDIFPSLSIHKEFPANYMDICQSVAKRLLRVYAHVYHHHLQDVRRLKEEAHMNTSLKHFIYFVKEFDLVTENDLEHLREYVQNIT